MKKDHSKNSAPTTVVGIGLYQDLQNALWTGMEDIDFNFLPQDQVPRQGSIPTPATVITMANQNETTDRLLARIREYQLTFSETPLLAIVYGDTHAGISRSLNGVTVLIDPDLNRVVQKLQMAIALGQVPREARH